LGHQLAFQFRLPTKILFDVPAAETVGSEVGNRRAVLVCSNGFKNRKSDESFRAALKERLVYVAAGVPSNPSVNSICKLAKEVAEHRPDVLIAVGGGSVIDAAKGIAAVFAEDCQEPHQLLNLLRNGGQLRSPQKLPVLSVPTTSGTGSEVTSFATIWDDENHKKYSVDGPQNAPETAILDPALTLSLPENDTVSTGLDAISQGLESFWNKRSNPATQAWAAEAIRVSMKALPALMRDLSDLTARREMMLGSLLAGMSISQTRTGVAHAISYPLTAHFGTPHGIACSFTLASILRKNVEHDDGRFLYLTRHLGLGTTSQLCESIQAVLEITNVLGRLQRTVPDTRQIFGKFDEMFTAGRADNNFFTLGRDETMQILESSLIGFPVGDQRMIGAIN
jgi:alcohol dehydrogenase